MLKMWRPSGSARFRRLVLASAVAGASLVISLWVAGVVAPPGLFLKYIDAVQHPDPSRYQDFSPLYLALVRWVLPVAGIPGLRLLQAALLALAGAAAAVTAEMEAGVLAGVAAGLLVVTYRPFLVYAGILEPEILIVALLAAALHAAHRSRRAAGESAGAAGWAAAASVLLALAAMARPQYAALIPLWALWLFRGAGGPRRWRPAVWALLAGTLLLLPAAAHRLVRSGSLSVMNPGPVFYEGNGPQSPTGTYTPPRIVERLARTLTSGADTAHVAYRLVAAAETGEAARPAVANRYWAGLALAGMRHRPGRAVRRMASKAMLALAPHELHDLINADDQDRRLRRRFPWGFGLVLALSVAGLLAGSGALNRQLPALSIAGLSWAVQVVFYPSARQRLPMALGLMVAGGVLVAASRDARRRRIAVAAALALTAAVTYLGAPVACVEEAEARAVLGVLPPCPGETLAALLDGRSWRPGVWRTARAVALARDAFEEGRPVPASAPLAAALRRAVGPRWLRARAAGLAARCAVVSGETGAARRLARRAVALDPDRAPARAVLTALEAPSCPVGREDRVMVPGEDPMDAQLLLAEAAASVHGDPCAGRVGRTVFTVFPALEGSLGSPAPGRAGPSQAGPAEGGPVPGAVIR